MRSYSSANDHYNEQEPPIDADLSHAPEGGAMVTLGFFMRWGAVFFLLIVAVIAGMIISKSTAQLPDIRVLQSYHPNESTQIFDRNGILIANIHGDEDRVVVDLKDISPNVSKALLATEDNRFYEHNGVDPRGTLRALVTDLNSNEHAQGGSTISQQLVKNLFLTPEKSYTRKIAEAILALRVEKHYSKDRILEMYLNQVYFGNQSYGIEKAARRYFRRSSRELSIAQAALLCGLLKAPEALSPYNNPDGARRRQREVIGKMVEEGYITKKQGDEAVREPWGLNSRATKPSKHPYFVAYVIQELEKRYGEDVVRRGGLRVYTTMDEQAQTSAEKAVFDGVTKAPGGSGIKQGALVAMDVETGQVLAMVGGVDFQKNQFNAATQSRRAVGSTFKPFVYLTAFRLGKITTKTPISDVPVHYGNWSPHNWDGKYMGAMNIRKALTLSRNTTTVQVAFKVGIEEITKTCQAAGIHSPIDQNSSSFLGSSGVSPLELVTGYSTFARGGVYVEPTAIKRVEDSRGNPVPMNLPVRKRVFDQDDVAALVDILIDVVEKGTGKNAILPNRVVAGKTGTTDNMRDIWFMGFTPDVVAGVWMGDPANKPMHGVFGANSAKVWHDFAEGYYKAHPIPPQQFFSASPEYAERMGIIHLVDQAQLADARRRLQTERLDKNDDKVDGEPVAAVDRIAPVARPRRPKVDKATAKSDTAPATTPASDTVGAKPPTNKPANRPVDKPMGVPQNPAVNETPLDKQVKYKDWQHTLDKVQQHLDDQ